MFIAPNELLSGLVLNQTTDNKSPGKLLVGGDLYAGGCAENILSNGGLNSPWADFNEEIDAHHFSIVNLENPLTENSRALLKTGKILHARPECAVGIRAGGFNAVSLANNHIKDMGEIGVIDTIANCNDAGLKTVGAGRDLKEATRPLIVEIMDQRVAILAIAEGEFSVASETSAGVWPLTIVDNFYQIRQAKEIADFVLVIYHGGVEFFPLPTPDMVKICRFFIDAGANAVVSHHIHVPSGLEIYKSSPIVYSTGNFLFCVPQAPVPDWNKGFLVSLEIHKKAVTKLRLLPYTQCKGNCAVRLIGRDEAKQFLEEISMLSAKITDQEALHQEYYKLVRQNRQKYLSIALSLNSFEQTLLRKGVWPFWRTGATRFARLKNSYTCRSHADLIASVLNLELENRRFHRSDEDRK